LIGGEGGGVLGTKAAINVIEIRPEIVEIGNAHEGPEGASYDALRLAQVTLGERTDFGHRVC